MWLAWAHPPPQGSNHEGHASALGNASRTNRGMRALSAGGKEQDKARHISATDSLLFDPCRRTGASNSRNADQRKRIVAAINSQPAVGLHPNHKQAGVLDALDGTRKRRFG